jgi:hypothetical protein
MISPKDVEPFDAAAKRTIATWEKTIDEKLQKDRVWFHSYTHANSPEEFADIARRYHEAGWNVVVEVSPIHDGFSYNMTIRHPDWALPPGLVRLPQGSARR